MLPRLQTALAITLAAVAAFVAAPAASAADRKAPTTPRNVRVVSTSDTSIEIAWDRSTDNVGVAGYGLYRDASRVAGTTALRYVFSNLACGTSYKLGVDAFDAARNRSRIKSITAPTAACPITSPPSPSIVSAPTNSALPVISGTPEEGQMLTASEGTWSGSPTSYAYQWLRCDSAGANCGALSGATTKAYTLVTADVDRTLRIRVTASNAGGSSSATSGQTSLVKALVAASVSYPASYFTGPLGKNNILPAKPGAFLGLWPQGTIAEQQVQIANREQFSGRRFDFVAVHYAAPTDACYWTVPFSQGREKWIADRGSMPIISWTHGWTLDQVNAGQADPCLRDMGARFAAWGQPILLRIYWEFNGGWFRWSGSGTKFITAWKRTVDVMRSAGATNVGFVWAPDEGYFNGTSYESYPGDAYVDWVASDRYNWSTSPWRTFQTLFSDPYSGAAQIHDKYGPVKPYMVAETGSVEDPLTPGRKAQWHRDARDAIRLRFPYLHAFVYFDVDMTTSQGVNWRLDTSQSSLEGFRDMARDPHFNTRG